MVEKGKISALQMAILMHPTIIATGILLVPGLTAHHAERDLWMSPAWASLVGFLTVYIAIQLNRMYPKETIIEYSSRIVGTLPGKALGLIVLLFYLHVNGIIIREYGEFIIGIFLMQTPLGFVMGSMTLACAFAVRGGIEVLGRLGQMFVPIVLLLTLFMFFLIIPDMELENMFPIMEKGLMPSFKGSVPLQAWFSEFLLISFLLPFLTDREKGLKWGMISVFLVMVMMVVTNLATLFVLGGTTGTFLYPVMNIIRYVSVGDFLEHLESLVMAMWVIGAFMKISVFYYALALGAAQWLNLSDYRPLVFPLGFLLALFAVWASPNLQEMAHFLGTSGSFYLVSIQVGIPLFLLMIACIRKGKMRTKKEAKG
ncbi:endospore germination permease [Ammoniphilus sp. YIM 78166]|uniref:GerAB/ArcD/ProY family transporter n=1 Tax=Ammoniphilus sp. YIM 78166 TaxID=1644106 RepID=UPI00106FD1F0|nr:endospore germination permease [Ammoniphilus sp. YIM 78166]